MAHGAQTDKQETLEGVRAAHSACRLVRLKRAWAGSFPVKELLESTLQAVGGGEGGEAMLIKGLEEQNIRAH